MAKRGRRFTIYGAFSDKEDARREERKHKGAFVLTRKIRGARRYIVLKPR